jgi:hypothetical protein
MPFVDAWSRGVPGGSVAKRPLGDPRSLPARTVRTHANRGTSVINVISKQPWGVVTLDLTLGKVVLRQDWEYSWTVLTPLLPWTYAERKAFHDTTDRQIWGVWSNRVRYAVAGTTKYGKEYAKTGILVNFDIRWVTTGGHWKVSVQKVPKGPFFSSGVTFATKTIRLNSTDMAAYEATNANNVSNKKFRALPHEFGHTVGAGDEYNLGSPHLTDAQSVMNIGRELRARHLKLLTDTLNTMLPGVTFTPPAVIP